MLRVHRRTELRAALEHLRSKRRRLALVPTMGNLHAGHLSLIDRARREADGVVVSIFVNPLQFAPHEDFARYPRTLDGDTAELRTAGVDVLYAPEIDAIYPNGYPPATRICLHGPLSDELEGAFRPRHFDGVATVVAILLQQVRPDVAVFGEKDWQQLAVIRRMVSDLGIPVDIVGQPTIRTGDGLALSSRNQYLTDEQRQRAPRLQAALDQIGQALRAGSRDFDGLCKRQSAVLETAGFRVQYLEIRRPDLSAPTPEDSGFVVLAAAYLGDIRLIDNLPVDAH